MFRTFLPTLASLQYQYLFENAPPITMITSLPSLFGGVVAMKTTLSILDNNTTWFLRHLEFVEHKHGCNPFNVS